MINLPNELESYCPFFFFFFSGGGERKLNPAKVDGNGSFESREINPNTLTYFMPREQRGKKEREREKSPPSLFPSLGCGTHTSHSSVNTV